MCKQRIPIQLIEPLKLNGKPSQATVLGNYPGVDRVIPVYNPLKLRRCIEGMLGIVAWDEEKGRWNVTNMESPEEQ